MKERPRVVFCLIDESKNTANLNIPDVLRNGRIPNEAKYELERGILSKIWVVRDGIEFAAGDENGKSPRIFLKNLLQNV